MSKPLLSKARPSRLRNVTVQTEAAETSNRSAARAAVQPQTTVSTEQSENRASMTSARTSIIDTCTKFEKAAAEQSRSGRTCFEPFDLMLLANKALQVKSGTNVIHDWCSGQTGIKTAVSSSSAWPGVRASGSKHKQGLPNPSTVQRYAEALDSASEGLRATADSLLMFPACKAPGSDTGHTCDEAGLFASAVESALAPIITELKKRVDWEEIS